VAGAVLRYCRLKITQLNVKIRKIIINNGQGGENGREGGKAGR
jgi:hypothetical protein